MPSITMASRCADNLLPPGAPKQREADYLCLTVTCALMYHRDGSTVDTAGVPSGPQLLGTVWRSRVLLTWRATPLLPALSAQHSWWGWGRPSSFLVLVQGSLGRGAACSGEGTRALSCHCWGLQWEVGEG